MKIWFDSMD